MYILKHHEVPRSTYRLPLNILSTPPIPSAKAAWRLSGTIGTDADVKTRDSDVCRGWPEVYRWSCFRLDVLLWPIGFGEGGHAFRLLGRYLPGRYFTLGSTIIILHVWDFWIDL